MSRWIRYALLVGLLTMIIPQAMVHGQGQWIYLSPQPYSTMIPPQTTLALRQTAAIDARTLGHVRFDLIGTLSGSHQATLVLADDDRTIIVRPDRPFALKERVHFALHDGLRAVTGASLGGLAFSFDIVARTPMAVHSLADEVPAGLAQMSRAASAARPTASTTTPQALTLPADLPSVKVTLADKGSSPGLLFLNSFAWATPNSITSTYILVLDNAGQLVYYRKLPPVPPSGFDFKEQPTGALTYFDAGINAFRAMNDAYVDTDIYRAGNGYTADLHDLQLLPNGHALLLSYDSETVDMSTIVPGGNPAATVIGLIIQELDAAKNVIFQWRSWDHFRITDTTADLTAATIDYVHGNAIAVDTDGNLLLSSRHLDEITKINRQTGDIIWRWGGKNNQFQFVNDRPFIHQHDIRRIANGNLTLFDNRTDATPQYSRAVEYKVDETLKTARVVRQFRNESDTYSEAMGSHQRLSNNDSLVGWGSSQGSTLTEFAPDGTPVLSMIFGAPQVSYRAFRFRWHGYPAAPPQLVVGKRDGVPALFYSWNGSTDTRAYRVYGGVTSEPDVLIDTATKTAFETSTSLGAAYDAMCYFRVVPIDDQGRLGTPSNTVFRDTRSCNAHETYLPRVDR